MTPPPNEKLAGLADILGEADTRALTVIFLETFPVLLRELATGDRISSHRAAHSLKSSAQQMGATALAQRMAGLETRLANEGEVLTASDIEGATADFAQVEASMRAFAGV